MFADIAVFSVQTPARKQKSTRPSFGVGGAGAVLAR